MDLESVPEALQERLGTEATVGLLHVVDAAGREWKAAVMESAVDRFERRLVEETSLLRVQIAESEGRLKEQITNTVTGLEVRLERRISDYLKWSFVFWIGQVFAMTAIMTAIMNVMLRGR